MAKNEKNSVYFDRNSLEFIGLHDIHMSNLKTMYPGVDIDSELIKMSNWLQSPKGNKRIGNMAFILNWFNKIKNPFLSTPYGLDTSYTELVNKYLEDLWKDKTNLLEFNTLRNKT